MTMNTTRTVPAATWGDVTLGEFAALDLIRDPNGLDRINRYWDAVHTDPANVFAGPAATRLTPEGLDWWAGLHDRFHADPASAALARELAQDALKVLGTLTVNNAAKLARA